MKVLLAAAVAYYALLGLGTRWVLTSGQPKSLRVQGRMVPIPRPHR